MADDNEFERLADEWEAATCYHSNPHIIMRHPACRAIAALGEAAVPLCLRRLRRRGSLSWCHLLREVTGEDPAPAPEREGGFVAWDVGAMVRAWLEWGETRGS